MPATSIFPYVYDAVFLALLVAAAVLGRRRGFLATLVLLVGSLAAILGAAWAARTAAPGAYDAFFADLVSQQVTAALAEVGGDAAALLQGADFLPETLRATLLETLNEMGESAGPQAAQALAPVVLPLLQGLLFLVFYLVARALVRLLASLLRHLNAVPLVGSLNKVLGLLLGVALGAVNGWVFSLVLWLAGGMAAGRVPALGSAVLEASFFYRFFSAMNPFLVLG